MKTWMIAAPLALLMATAALAQTTGTTAEQPEGSGQYGSAWPESIGGAFMSTDNETMTLRTDDELATGWTALTQTDRDMVLRDCTAFKADADAGVTGGAATGTVADDTTSAPTPPAGSDADVAAKMALSAEDMTRLCAKVMAM